jgi:hypothetical protein
MTAPSPATFPPVCLASIALEEHTWRRLISRVSGRGCYWCLGIMNRGGEKEAMVVGAPTSGGWWTTHDMRHTRVQAFCSTSGGGCNHVHSEPVLGKDHKSSGLPGHEFVRIGTEEFNRYRFINLSWIKLPQKFHRNRFMQKPFVSLWTKVARHAKLAMNLNE